MAKNKTEIYNFPANCHVCGEDFFARRNIAKRAKVCTPKSHKCRKGKRGDRKIACTDKPPCCRSRYGAAASRQMMDQAIDKTKVLTDDELSSVVRKTFKVNDPYGIALRLIATTGCRLGESLLIRTRDLRLSEKIPAVRIPTLKRGGRPVRTVHLYNEVMVAELKKWTKTLDSQALLFKSCKRTLQRKLETIFEGLGFRNNKEGLVHILRHTRASQLVAAGYDLNYVRQQLGWSSLDMAMIYSHSHEDKIIEQSKNLPKIGRRR